MWHVSQLARHGYHGMIGLPSTADDGDEWQFCLCLHDLVPDCQTSGYHLSTAVLIRRISTRKVSFLPKSYALMRPNLPGKRLVDLTEFIPESPICRDWAKLKAHFQFRNNPEVFQVWYGWQTMDAHNPHNQIERSGIWFFWHMGPWLHTSPVFELHGFSCLKQLCQEVIQSLSNWAHPTLACHAGSSVADLVLVAGTNSMRRVVARGITRFETS